MADDDVEVRFGGNVDDLANAVKESKNLIGSIGSAVKGFIGSFASGFTDEFVGLFTSGAGISEIIEFSRHMAELGDEAQRTAQMLGLTVEAVTDFQFAVQATGGNARQATSLMERLELAMEGGGRRTAQSAAAFKALGISTVDAAGKTKSLQQILDETADVFQRSADGPAKTAVAMALMGRAGVEMIPLLNRGAAGMHELYEEARATGSELSTGLAASLTALNENFQILDMSVVGLGQSIFSFFIPAANAIVTGITSVVVWFNNAVTSSTVLTNVLGGIALAFNVIVSAVILLITTLGALWDFADGVVQALATEFQMLGRVIKDVFTFNWGDLQAAFAAGWAGILDTATETVDKIGANFEGAIERIKKMFKEQIIGGPAAPKSGTGGLGNIGDIMKGSQNADQIERSVKAAWQQVAALEAQAEAFGMAQGEAISFLTQQKLIAQAVALSVPITDTLAESFKKVGDATAEATLKLQQLNVKQGVMMDLAKGITGAFMSWIDGTESLGMAFIKLAIQIAEAVIEAVILSIVMTALGIPMAAGPAGGFFGLLFGGGKAQGGPMQPGSWYMAGERGPEPIYAPGAIAGGYPPNDGGSKGMTIHFAPNVQALDAAGVDRVLSRHLDKMTKMVSRHMSKNPSARPEW